MEYFEIQNTDMSKSIKISQTLSQAMPPEAQDQIVNRNIEDLKKLQISSEMFDEIYIILNRIAIENDFIAMNFAMKDNFCDVKNKFHQTIFYCSIENCDYHLSRLIIEFDRISGYSYDILQDPVYLRLIFKIQLFNVNYVLQWASANGHHEIVKLLLTVPGIDVNAKDKDNNTALILASWFGHHEVVKLLLTVPGIDVNAKDKYNNTALIWSSFYGHHEVVKLLLTVPGIDVNAKTNGNYTALIWASRRDFHEVVKLLLTVPGID